jgi:hypothetical protein
MVDLTADEGSGRSLKVVWSSYIGGPAGPNIYYDVKRLKNAIDQAFEQSPYINRNAN